MWGWVKEVVTAILEFIEKIVSKETHAENADPDAGGVRSRFWDRVRKHRDSGPGGDSSSTG
jgi:hypothetical protein